MFNALTDTVPYQFMYFKFETTNVHADAALSLYFISK